MEKGKKGTQKKKGPGWSQSTLEPWGLVPSRATCQNFNSQENKSISMLGGGCFQFPKISPPLSFPSLTHPISIQS